MRYTSFIVAGLFAVAANAVSSTTPTTAPVSTTASVDPAQSSAASEIEKCLAACDESDTECRAHCIAVPSPDNQNVDETTKCVAACPKGNGTAADNDAYADCVSGCIGQYYFTNTGTPDLATSSKPGGSGSSVTQVPTTIVTGGSTIVTTVPTTTAASGDDNESDAPKTTSSSSAGAAHITAFPHVGTVGTGLGLAGLIAGVLAL
ncbi:hypothetical protein F5Y17DRAFT_23051 [Xylariaceae sp. FL0594]|nr:hypothetical protein F5Y17DRAFT_23051 [Xylariaceae sp. FL0594]